MYKCQTKERTHVTEAKGLIQQMKAIQSNLN
jgi:hypothetical protein